jgi:hypothetical protein
MDELFPIATGFVLGIIFATGFGWFRRKWIRLTLILLAGISATIASGEYTDSWAFAIVDIGEVALFAWIGFFCCRRLRTWWQGVPRTGKVEDKPEASES